MVFRLLKREGGLSLTRHAKHLPDHLADFSLISRPDKIGNQKEKMRCSNKNEDHIGLEEPAVDTFLR